MNIKLRTGDQIVLREANINDAQEINLYYNKLSDESKKRFAPHQFTIEALKSILGNTAKFIVFIAERSDQKEIVAYYIIQKGYIDGELERHHFYDVTINHETTYTLAPSLADEYQSKGLGSKLLKTVLIELKKKGAIHVTLWGGVQATNKRAVNFYLKNGFRKNGDFNYKGPNYDMVKNLYDNLWDNSEWLKDLIIYEINPYAFTSPNGAGTGGGSGDLKELTIKLDYIAGLGVTGIWLAGYSSATVHFKNIAAVYACERPDKIDPRLGNEKDLKKFISEAHKRGLKVFLEAVTHGVTKSSSLVKEHPDWFKGSSWGMADYNIENPEFRDWYKQTMLRYITEFNADGFRLDGPNGIQPQNEIMRLWDEIVTECGRQNHSMLVFPENWFYHFQQGLDETEFGFIGEKEFNSIPRYKCRAISNHDYGIEAKAPESFYQLKGSRCKLAHEYIFKYDIPLLMSGEEFNADFVPLPDVRTGLFGDGEVCSWLYASWIQWEQLAKPDKSKMLTDFKRILEIRKENSDILHYDRLRTKYIEPAFKSNNELVPQPYIRYISDHAAILVLGNYAEEAAEIKVELPLSQLFNSNYSNYSIVNLWDKTRREVKASELNNLKVKVSADKIPGGGFIALRIERLQ